MSGVYLTIEKNGKYSCGGCGNKKLKLDFSYCPYCGEEIVMVFDDNENECEE